MADPKGFLTTRRETPARRPVDVRLQDWREVYTEFGAAALERQAGRCMDCGIPFCHSGCPLGNLIPEWNDLVWRQDWREAAERLHATNNFPEFTGRLCPAPCEAACVLGISEPPVTIKQIEKTVVDRAFEEGWILPEPPSFRTGKRVAVIGSGPAGMAASQQLARAGHDVSLFEKNDRIGGLLRYGIPNFKMEKRLIDRRMGQMEAEGVRFITNAHVGQNIAVDDLRREYDALLLTGGAEWSRDLKVPGRELKGIHFAMEFLPQQNRRCEGDAVLDEGAILATGKRVVIIGGGDTGADCLGTSHRQKAYSVHQFELMPEPPRERSPQTPWPLWPMQLRTESSHEEGGQREWAIATTRFIGDAYGNVKQLQAVRVGPPPKFEPIPGTEIELDVELVLLAMGFLGPVRNGMLDQLGVKLDARGNVAVGEDWMSSVAS